MKKEAKCVVSKDELQDLINTSSSFRNVGKKIGKPHGYVRLWASKYNIDCSNIVNKHTKSLINQKKHLLKIIEIYFVNKRKMAKCVCDCGNLINIRYDSLTKTLSCGCLKGSSMKRKLINEKDYKKYKINKTIYADIKKTAKRRNIEFNLSIDYLWELFIKQNKKCSLSGLDLQFSNLSTYKTASLDRIDSSKGYIEGNVQWVHKDINRMKSFLYQDNFIELCLLVSSYQQQKENNVS